MKHGRRKFTGVRGTAIAVAALLAAQAANPAWAGAREQAGRIHDRLAGVPPSEAVLAQMTADISGGNPQAAALRAMGNKNFYVVYQNKKLTPEFISALILRR